MRLLHTETYEVRRFDNEDDLPPYAILSHVWNQQRPQEEVTFADMQNVKQARKRGEWPKVEQFCALARRNGLQWAWDDTCCIDKSSSAELSQAINSMYAWYGGARVCYAYLSDVEDPGQEDPAAEESTFRKSRWFRRGWTLQELIAPKVVLFFSKSWKPLGSKFSLAAVVEEITNVDAAVLRNPPLLDSVSIARRMSWAAGRVTFHTEDRAYSLMGIFGIHMPTIYGEGCKAFIRLQLEIIRQSTDQSIFAWGKPYDFQDFLDNVDVFTDKPLWAADFRSLLASSPDSFRKSANIVPFPVDEFTGYTHAGISCDVPEYTPTNYGTQIHLPLYVLPGESFGLALLGCKDATTGEVVALFVRRREGSTNRFHVGVYTPNTPPMQTSGWHPTMRMFLVQPRSHDACARILQRVVLTRMYLHSYNANPQRSIAQGLACGDLRMHRRRPSGELVNARPKPRQVSFVIFGSLLRQLQDLGINVAGYGEKSPVHRGWTPRDLWRQVPGVGLRLTLEYPPPSEDSCPGPPPDSQRDRHAAVLFRGNPQHPGQAGTAFALVFGIADLGTVWATVVIIKPSHRVDASTDQEVSAMLVRGIRETRSFQDITDKQARDEGYDVSTWTNSTYEQRPQDAPPRAVKVTLSRWMEQEEQGVLDSSSVMTYTVGLEVDFGPEMRLWGMSEEETIGSLSRLSLAAAQ